MNKVKHIPLMSQLKMCHIHTITRSEWLFQNFDFLLTALPKRMKTDAIKFSHLKVTRNTLFRVSSSQGADKEIKIRRLKKLLAGQSHCP